MQAVLPPRELAFLPHLVGKRGLTHAEVKEKIRGLNVLFRKLMLCPSQRYSVELRRMQDYLIEIVQDIRALKIDDAAKDALIIRLKKEEDQWSVMEAQRAKVITEAKRFKAQRPMASRLRLPQINSSLPIGSTQATSAQPVAKRIQPPLRQSAAESSSLPVLPMLPKPPVLVSSSVMPAKISIKPDSHKNLRQRCVDPNRFLIISGAHNANKRGLF